MGNNWGGYSDTPDRIYLFVSLRRCTSKGPPLVVGRPRRIILSGVREDAGQGVLPGVGVFDTRLSTVLDGGALGIPKARFRVSLIDRRPLSLRRSQFISMASPVM